SGPHPRQARPLHGRARGGRGRRAREARGRAGQGLPGRAGRAPGRDRRGGAAARATRRARELRRGVRGRTAGRARACSPGGGSRRAARRLAQARPRREGGVRVIVYLVRHATAGHRKHWDDDDTLRPLDERGRRQAEALVGQLAGRELGRIVPSPYLRCMDTVVPLASARSMELEPTELLAEGAGADEAFRLFSDGGGPLVACVHGDLAEDLLGEHVKKGATVVLEVEDGELSVLEPWEPQA